jgi:uncharacterized protein YcaQ
MDAARALLLTAQGLLKPPHSPATKDDVHAAIRQMGALQIDTIHIVARSPYFVLWSRLGAYEPRWLDDLLAEGSLFEYWGHAATFLPIEDYGLYRRYMLEQTAKSRAWLAENPEVVEHVLTLVRTQGAVRSADFPRSDGRAGGWWDHKPEKIALECLYDTGDLMIARRENFQRVYDLQERVLPNWDDRWILSADEIKRKLVEKTIRSLGIAPIRWIPDYFRLPKKGIAGVVEQLVEEGIVLPVRVNGWKEPAYVSADNHVAVEMAATGGLQPRYTTLLSPFDPVVWDRNRAQELFGFNYRIEVYTPAAQRRYGYFTLPILHDGALIGRVDPKAHRQQGVFEVKVIHLEEGVTLTPHLLTELAATLHACALWHNTPDIVISQTEPPELQSQLQPILNQLCE